ncbi:Hypothetical protein AT6N2_L0222 [Agrobacterium tumefaciens]|nr:Hypothetical protein AT6N2_L0222 [Agrobacterium tumefaciens]
MMVDGIHAERQGLVQALSAVTDPFQPFTQLFDNEQLIRALLHGMTGFNLGYSSYCSCFVPISAKSQAIG